MIIRFLIIILLAGYSGVMTSKYLETKKERDYWKARYNEIMFVPDYSQPKGKIYEVKIDTHYIIKWKTKKEIVKDSVFVYQIEPARLTDTLKVGYNWVWKNFLSVRDTYFVYQDTANFKFNLSLHRYWQIVNPLKLTVVFYDKKPYEYWWRLYAEPEEFEGLLIQGFEDVRKWNIFLGGGLFYDGSYKPYADLGISYKRHNLDFLVGVYYIGVGYKFRIY